MLEKGFDVEVLSMLRPELNLGSDTNVHPEKVETAYENHGKLRINRLYRDKRLLTFDLKFFSYMLKRKYSLIHLHSLGWHVDNVPWLISRLKGTPMVFTTHSHDTLLPLMDPQSQMTFMQKKIMKNVLLVRDSPTCVFIAFTKYQAECYLKLGIKNIRIIPHGVDSNAFKVKPDETLKERYGLGKFNILCVGTIEPRKGQLILIKSMTRILKEFPDTKLILLGRAGFDFQKNYLQTMKSYVSALNLADKVIFLNDAPKDDLIQLYLLSTVFVLPTNAEMFGLVFLEAMAAGLPIISTNKPHIKEILGNGEAGAVVERDQVSVENEIIRFLGDNELRKRLGYNGKRIVEQKYRIDKVIKQYWALYQSLLDHGK
jgi:glycosyltransferase involved in cell wall biosynthesis